MQRTWIATGLVLIGVAVMAGASRAESPERTHDIVADDYFSLATLGACQVSPDGKYVAYLESRWDKTADKRNTDLWVVPTRGGKVRRLTFDRAGDGSPQWGPDSRTVYFSSSRKRADEKDPPYNGKSQVWRVSVDGGEPTPVTRIDDGVGQFRLSANGETLYYTTTKEKVDEEWEDLRGEFSDLQYGHGVTNFSQVWKLDLVHWRSEKLIDEHRVVQTFEVSPDERRIAMLTTPDEELLVNEGWSRVDVYDVATNEVSAVTADGWREGHPSPFGWLDDISWSSDSAALAFTISFDGFPTQIYVAEWAGGEPTLFELARPDSVTVNGGTAHWRGKSRDLCFNGADRARTRIFAIAAVKDGRQGPTRTLTPDDVVVGAYGFSGAGDVMAVIMGTPTRADDIYTVSNAGSYERLTDVNPQVDTWRLPQLSIVKWKGANGDDVEGILELPPDHKPGKPLPMVVEIHGGPTSASTYSLRFWIYGRTLMAARGYALLSPNYRGSTGYGDKFLVELIGHENEIEVEDILTGVDAMVERGIADGDKLAVMGWSNGGFLTNCLITKTKRFKAASSGAGVLDQVMQWGIEDTPGHVINYMQGLPWKLPEHYREGSPLYNLDKVTTPTVIHVGENDSRVPAGHARTLYRALHHYLHVPTELVVYPGAGHGLTTYKHRKAKMEWDLAWFDRYLIGETKDAAPAPTTN